jgi:hypothetical protein
MLKCIHVPGQLPAPGLFVTRETGTSLILEAVATDFGRLGHLFASEREGWRQTCSAC